MKALHALCCSRALDPKAVQGTVIHLCSTYYVGVCSVARDRARRALLRGLCTRIFSSGRRSSMG